MTIFNLRYYALLRLYFLIITIISFIKQEFLSDTINNLNNNKLYFSLGKCFWGW